MIAYPTLDAILMVPAIVILLDIRNEPLWFTPWICESLGLLLIALSDSWFALVVLTSFTEHFWLSSLFFSAHALVMTAGLVWYLKYLSLHHHDAPLLRPRREATNVPRLHNDHIIDVIPTPDSKKVTRKKRMRTGTIISISLILVSGFVVHPAIFSFGNANTEIIIPALAGSKHNITLGAFLSLSGTSASLGESEEAGLKIAVKDVNEYFKQSDTNLGVGLVIHFRPLIGYRKAQGLGFKRY